MSANPQGKGLVPVLEHWQSVQPSVVRPREPQHVLKDYLVSSLVLSADFRFQPRPGVTYFLYRGDQRWQLSMISPDQWGERSPGDCLGSCQLQPDMTWALSILPSATESPELHTAMEAFRDGFLDWLDQDGELEDHLPFYAEQLPYYARLLAAGMASSLKRSMVLSGLNARDSRDWLQAMSGQGLLT